METNRICKGIGLLLREMSVHEAKDKSDAQLLHGHPGAQELIWGHIDYQVTPEMHMRKIPKWGKTA